jgi:hypothetical protein
MAAGSNPGLDAQGYRDGSSIKLMFFASTAARDTWVTAQGGTTKIPSGFACYCVGTNVVTVWNGSAWRSIATA